MEIQFSNKHRLDLTDLDIVVMSVETIAHLIDRYTNLLPVTDQDQRERVLSYVPRWPTVNALEEDDMRKFLTDLRNQYRQLKERRYLVPV